MELSARLDPLSLLDTYRDVYTYIYTHICTYITLNMPLLYVQSFSVLSRDSRQSNNYLRLSESHLILLIIYWFCPFLVHLLYFHRDGASKISGTTFEAYESFYWYQTKQNICLKPVSLTAKNSVFPFLEYVLSAS